MNILVTGGAGYLGAILVPKLVVRGHRVRVIDIGYFGFDHLRGLTSSSVELVRENLCRIAREKHFLRDLLEHIDCIIHLAAISNDPSAELHPDLTDELNYGATTVLAEAARQKGIRFLFSSSCSVYGQAEGDITEDGVVHPLTVYAITKWKAEKALEDM